MRKIDLGETVVDSKNSSPPLRATFVQRNRLITISGAENGILTIYRTSTGEVFNTIDHGLADVSAIVGSTLAPHVLIVAPDRVALWDVNDGAQIGEHIVDRSGAVAFAECRRAIVRVSREGDVTVFEPQSDGLAVMEGPAIDIERSMIYATEVADRFFARENGDKLHTIDVCGDAIRRVATFPAMTSPFRTVMVIASSEYVFRVSMHFQVQELVFDAARLNDQSSFEPIELPVKRIHTTGFRFAVVARDRLFAGVAHVDDSGRDGVLFVGDPDTRKILAQTPLEYTRIRNVYACPRRDIFMTVTSLDGRGFVHIWELDA